jgi:hypothetical protein
VFVSKSIYRVYFKLTCQQNHLLNNHPLNNPKAL